MPRERAVHGARIDINVTQHFREVPGRGALAAGTRAVDGDDSIIQWKKLSDNFRIRLRFFRADCAFTNLIRKQFIMG